MTNDTQREEGGGSLLESPAPVSPLEMYARRWAVLTEGDVSIAAGAWRSTQDNLRAHRRAGLLGLCRPR
jgi:hypothetical protein